MSPAPREAEAEGRAAASGRLALEDRPPPSATGSGTLAIEDADREARQAQLEAYLAASLRALRAAEREVLDLRSALEATRQSEGGGRCTQTAPADALGWVVAVGGAKETLDGCLRALARCDQFAYVLAYSFDLGSVVDALVAARTRGIDVRILLDKAQSLGASTTSLRPVVMRLRRQGVKVRLSRGRQHAKALLTDKECVLGSANWTESSQQRRVRRRPPVL